MALVFVAACGPIDFDNDSTTNGAGESKTYTEPLARIVFGDIGPGSLTIRTTRTGVVEIHRSMTWWKDGPPPQPTETLEGKTLHISHTCKMPGRTCIVSYDMRVPTGTEIQAKTTSGYIYQEGLITAPLDLETDSGGVDVGQVKGNVTIKTTSGKVGLGLVSGDVDIKTTSGGVSGWDLRSMRVAVATDSGYVGLGFDSPPQSVKVNTNSGGTSIYVPRRDAYRVGVKTMRGHKDILVNRSETAPRQIDVESTSGDVTIDYG